MTRTFLQMLRRTIAGAAVLVLFPASPEAADWVVSKASGQVWVASEQAQPASLGTQTTLLPGDTIRTGPHGRVLLVRGEETILVAPNSVLALPGQSEPSTTTIILQQAGSIAVKAQKRDFNHFEVRTPFLAAVVKGTEFVVSIKSDFADVQVMSGQVEVADFKSGQIALVMPGQGARSSSPFEKGLKLEGSGALNPVRPGPPDKATLQPVHVPKAGLGPPPSNGGQHIRALSGKAASALSNSVGVVRISSPIGNVKLNVQRATGGLARSDTGYGRTSVNTTVWNSSGQGTVTTASSQGSNNSSNAANSSGNGNGGGIGIGGGVGNGSVIGIGAGGGNGATLGVGIVNGTVSANIGKALGKKK